MRPIQSGSTMTGHDNSDVMFSTQMRAEDVVTVKRWRRKLRKLVQGVKSWWWRVESKFKAA